MSDKPPGAGHLNFGDFRRTSPIDDNYGLERGTPIDRSYIERFLERHRANIASAVLEMGELTEPKLAFRLHWLSGRFRCLTRFAEPVVAPHLPPGYGSRRRRQRRQR